MNCTLRRVAWPMKKWSRFEKWFGAKISGPLVGTFALSIVRVR